MGTPPDLCTDLTMLRAEIDEIDNNLLELLNKRADLARRIGRIKKQNQPPEVIYCPGRENDILVRLQALNQAKGGLLPPSHLDSIWLAIFASAKALQ